METWAPKLKLACHKYMPHDNLLFKRILKFVMQATRQAIMPYANLLFFETCDASYPYDMTTSHLRYF